MKIIRNTRGFSLIEALVVVGVLAIVAIVMVDLLFRTVRGGNKTQLIGNIKQNGQTALSVLDTTIRSADKVICKSSYTGNSANTFLDGSGAPLPDTLVIAKDGKYTRFRFYFERSGTSNGYIGKLDLVVTDPSTVGQTLCADNPTSDTKLTPDDGAISLKYGGFEYTQSINLSHKDVVGIKFDMGPSYNSGTSFDQQSANVTFSTTVELR
jgi:type II secretory pathway pseudopilin PulG